MRMITPGRPHLVVPGHREDFAEKAHSYGADFILWDLEDGVPEKERLRAEAVVQKWAAPGDAVRLARPWVVTGALAHLEFWYAKAEWSPAWGYVGVPIIETAAAVRDVHLIAGVASGLAFGAYDFAAACGVSTDSPLVEHARLHVLLAAKAAGIPAYDAPCKDLDPGAAYAAACGSRALGFDSKGVLHPSHLEGTTMAWSAGTMAPEEAEEVAALENAGVAAGRFWIPAEIRAAKAQVEG